MVGSIHTIAARRVTQTATALVLATLTACGGGGTSAGGMVTTAPPVLGPSPTPTTTPAPAPVATPAPTTTASVAHDTGEYRATVGAVSMNALAAYNQGATGAGVNVAIIDTGIDTTSPEFPGRVSSASQNVAGGNGYADQSGHGTAVAFTLAGRRNDTGTHGVAYDATIIALRADTPGSCDSDGCSFRDASLARGIDVAVAAGARVINMSLSNSAAFGSNVQSAIGRATAAGIVVVLSAGNQNEKNPALAIDPELSAQVANNAAVSRGLVVVAGSIGASDAMAANSNRAGNTAAYYLTAVGERIAAPGTNGDVYLWSGTSFAAPQISAAVALLAQAFPNLSGKQIVDLLYATARDAGAAGTDGVYGRGILDLTRAFQPTGTATLASSSAPVSMTANGTLSPAMGDAKTAGMGAVILDGFNRAFAVDLANTIRRATPQPMLFQALDGRTQAAITRAKGLTVAMTVAPSRDGARVERAMLLRDQADGARALAGSVTQALGKQASFALGFATGGQALTAQLAGRGEPAFLIARQADTGLGFDSGARGSAAMRVERGAFGLTAAAETGQVSWRGSSDVATLDGRWQRSPYDRFALTLDRRVGPVALTAGVSRLNERDTILGAHLGDGLGGGSATSWFGDLGARLNLADGWTLGGSYREGRTQAKLGGAIAGTGTIVTRAWAGDIGKTGVLGVSDAIGFRVSQPLRVARGGIDIAMPTYWDYASQSVTQWTEQRLNLAPTGREQVYEGSYTAPLGTGWLSANVFWRQQPGNIANAPSDTGAAVRYSFTF